MKRRELLQAALAIPLVGLQGNVLAGRNRIEPSPFGFGGSKKMLYDVRQRPQAVLFGDKVYLGFKGGGIQPPSGRGHRVAPTYATILTYSPETREFSLPVRFGDVTDDHHDCPVIWIDRDEHVHFLYRCHNEPGVHFVSNQPKNIGASESDWTQLPDIAPKVSYPTVFHLPDGNDLIYYRTAGHSSSWSYKISNDKGRSWEGPENSVTDLDLIGFPEWSTYQSKIISKDRRTLHVVFTDYDDVKSDDPRRLFNPRYQQVVDNEHKYNLSYVKIDLESGEVRNHRGEVLETPVHMETARLKCRIWDTVWRGAGVPPALSLDDAGNPEMLHVLSEESVKKHGYYYVRFENDEWRKTRVTSSNHQWNSGYLKRNKNGHLHAYVIVGDGYQSSSGINYSHGGGRVEHWLSKDDGNTWQQHREITPDPAQYPGWSFNNVQPVVRQDGTTVDGMLIFYGWLHGTKPDAVAFLLDESNICE